MEYLFLLIVVAILGNYIIRALLARLDREPARRGKLEIDSSEVASVDLNEVLGSWGQVNEDPSFQPAGPLHLSIIKYLRHYQLIGPDKFVVILQRSLTTQPFRENNEFTQIGVWFDGSEVLMHRDASDPRVYLADIEGDSRDPDVLAESFEQFLRYVWVEDHGPGKLK